MLITAGDNSDRVRSEAAFAKMCGACPIPAGSGKTNGRHRLYRGGHRQANAALYRAVIVRMRRHQPTIDCVERRTTECLSKRESSAASSAASPGRSTGCCHRRSPSTATRSGVSELWRDDHGTTPVSRRCPTCATTFTSTGRQRYCQASSRKKAHRLRYTPAEPETTVPAARPQRPHTVYQWPDCDGLQPGEQRCRDCRVFGRSLGLGGNCPHCTEPVTLQDLDLTPQR